MRIRELDAGSDAELEVVTRMCQRTVLETIPELRGSEEAAQSVFGNFDYESMHAMVRASARSAAHRLLVAVDEHQGIVAHSMISRKVDADGRPYGYFFTRFVEPSHRRRGIASRLLEAALSWFAETPVDYLRAETHVDNHALQAVFSRAGFEIVERHSSPWPYVVLTRRGFPG